MDAKQENAALSLLKEIYGGQSRAAALLDRTLACTWSGSPELFSEGMALQNIVRDKLDYPMHSVTLLRVLIRDEFYCARITPLKNEFGDPWQYICEFIGGDEAVRIAADTDLLAKVMPVFNALEYNLAGLWKSTNALKQLHPADEETEQIAAAQRAISNIGSVTKNAYEYTNMVFGERDAVTLDAAALSATLIKRCNAALAKCGRRVEFLCDEGGLFINADCKHAIAALVNAVQNALLYSPRESVPMLAVYRINSGRRSFVEFKFTNDNIMFTEKDFSEDVNVNFSYQRIGWGIPIIRRFAEESGGRFYMEDDGGRMCVKLTLPSPISELSADVALEQYSYVYYDTGIPDIVETKMREVAEFFGENS